MMLSRPLQLVLGVTVLLVGYTWWQGRDGDGDEPALDTRARSAGRVAPASASAAANASAASAVAASKPAALGASFAVNLFPKQTWAPTPPPPPTPGPPPPTPIPVAPPLPFAVVASWHEKGVDEFVLEAAGQQYVVCNRCDALGRVQLGETLLGIYRIDQLSRQQIVFTYLPLNQQQVLPIGGTP
ncbi:hypothetical protein IGB42_02767 [Andreprevotia sp. IGB-42]|uniref:hypothetical protein n=1 Tax=Andreprevotia sp. IGB-42 TaxID=2497473 RepID=UPI00135A7D39|nr:hypothetical protein [Andreprevotia sp. IGB-42]KAF0812919.1 hypothetical protein IGB42_02767 [Andreprevotia sp. IGB-42]